MPETALRCAWTVLATALLLGGGAFAAEKSRTTSAEEIRACSRANLPDKTLVQEIEFQAHDRAGNVQRRRAKLYVKRYPAHDETRATLKVQSPAHVRGVSYLMIDAAGNSRFYLYLPAMQRVRRISGDAATDSLLGTDFAYADFRQLQAISANGEVKRLPDAKLADRDVYALALSPASPGEAVYRRIEFLVDKKTCVPLRAEFFAKGKTPRKRLKAEPESLRQVGDRWLATHLTMRDLRDDTHTTLDVLEAEYDESVSDVIFNQRTFNLGAVAEPDAEAGAG